MCCTAEPKLYKILQWQIAQVHMNLQPDGYFLSHDEIRVQGWDESCRRTGKTPGEILAGYYDGPVETITPWLCDAQRAGGLVGAMYTTWQNRYDDLEAFAAQLNKPR